MWVFFDHSGKKIPFIACADFRKSRRGFLKLSGILFCVSIGWKLLEILEPIIPFYDNLFQDSDWNQATSTKRIIQKF